MGHEEQIHFCCRELHHVAILKSLYVLTSMWKSVEAQLLSGFLGLTWIFLNRPQLKQSVVQCDFLFFAKHFFQHFFKFHVQMSKKKIQKTHVKDIFG